jgi:hypothetical protein
MAHGTLDDRAETPERQAVFWGLSFTRRGFDLHNPRLSLSGAALEPLDVTDWQRSTFSWLRVTSWTRLLFWRLVQNTASPALFMS